MECLATFAVELYITTFRLRSRGFEPLSATIRFPRSFAFFEGSDRAAESRRFLFDLIEQFFSIGNGLVPLFAMPTSSHGKSQNLKSPHFA